MTVSWPKVSTFRNSLYVPSCGPCLCVVACGLLSVSFGFNSKMMVVCACGWE